MLREYAGGAKRTSLAGDITATSTNILVADATGYPTGTTGPFAIAINVGVAAEEKILVASRSGNTLTVAAGGRGYDGTTAAEHRIGATIDHVLTATDVREANAHVNDTTGDPHPQYLTPTEANAAYPQKAGTETISGAWTFTTPPEGVASALLVVSEVVLDAAAATINFASIPGTYRSLRVILAGRLDAAVASDNVWLRFNGDAAANYDEQQLRGNGTTVFAEGVAGRTYAPLGQMAAGTATAGRAGVIDALIPNYAGTTYNKLVLADAWTAATTTATTFYRGIHGVTWRSSAAVTSMSLIPASGNFAAGTVATLYAIKGA